VSTQHGTGSEQTTGREGGPTQGATGARPPQRSYRTILRHVIVAGLAEFRRPTSGLALSSFSAGLDAGFSVLLMGVMFTLFDSVLHPAVVHLLMANMYAVGFILVILGRSELFTEHTALAVLPVIDGHESVRALTRVWSVVFAGNITGAVLFALITVLVAPAMGIVRPEAFSHIALGLTEHPWWLILASAVLAGWLMGELAWLLAAGRDTMSQIVCVWIVTAGIGVAQLHHVVVGTVEVLAGVLVSPDLGLVDLGRFVVLAATGNAIGGVVFVALIKYSHAVRGHDELADIELTRIE
jgi:formate/nitrite transporter FocA (FNT family)